MPHEPWIYLPSGHQSRPAGEDPIPDLNHDVGFDDPDLTEQNHLRHLLQVGYTDRLVGELLDRLERTGLLERALVVVTADHGYSFRVGVKSRRLISDDNVEEIAPVPLFVKAPGQMEPSVSRVARAQHRHARRPSPTCSARGSSTSRTVARRSRARRASATRSRCGPATSRERCVSGLRT